MRLIDITPEVSPALAGGRFLASWPSIEGGALPTVVLTDGRKGRPPGQVPGMRTMMPAACSAGTSERKHQASVAVQRNGW